MKILASAIWFLVLLSIANVAGGQTASPTATPLRDADETVRITTKIVQLDFLVVDKDGRAVTDLAAGDVEVLQDGKPQTLTGFSFVNGQMRPADGATARASSGTTAGVTRKVRPENSGRILTFIVDDGSCATTTVGVTATREGLKKFINEQMQPDDLIGIYRTRAGSSVLQQYTNDKARLLSVVEKIQWRPPMGACSSIDGSTFAPAKSNVFIKTTPTGKEEKEIESADERKIRERNEDQLAKNQTVGTLGVIRYVINGLKRVPGRKVVFFFSDGLPIQSRSGEIMDTVDALRDLTDLANRASVVFNTVDSRGLFDPTMIEARDEVYGNEAEQIRQNRTRDAANSQEGLSFIANETGGTFYRNQNYLDNPIRQALSRETGYYLVAYEPAGETFRGKRFNKIEIRLKRPDLKVRSRAGFLGFVNDEAPPKRRTSDGELFEAIMAPLPVPGLKVDLTAYFANTATAGNIVRSFFHIDGDYLAFTDDGDKKKAVLDVVAVTLNEKNEIADEFNRTHTLRFETAAVGAIKKNGLVYSVDVPIKKPGTYNFRVAVRDGVGRLIGSAGETVQVPDAKKADFAVSGLTLSALDSQGKFDRATGASSENAISLPMSSSVPAIRRMRRGEVVAYAYTIYNARVESTTGQPRLTVQVNVYKDGKMISQGTPEKADLQKFDDATRIEDFGYMRLNAQAPSGDYSLEIIVTDELAAPRKAVSRQWVDFEIVD